MEPMELDTDSDESFVTAYYQDISDMDTDAQSPDNHNVKQTLSFDKLESALCSKLSFNSPPRSMTPSYGDNSCDENKVLKQTHELTLVSSKLKQNPDISNEEKLSLNNFQIFSTSNVKKRTKETIKFDLDNQVSFKGNILKSKARPLIIHNPESSSKEKNVTGCCKFLKFVLLLTFLVCVTVVVLTIVHYLKNQSCSSKKSFNKSLLEMDLEANVFGQHIAVNIIPTQIDNYLKKFLYEADLSVVCKPLVLSFHGWTGVGKNFVSKIISNTLQHSKVSHFIIPYHFPHEAYQSLYKQQINQWILDKITDCAINVVVIDEMDKAHLEVVEGIAAAIHSLTKPCDLASPSIFLLLSNSHAVDINRAFLKFMREPQGNQRESFHENDLNFVIDETSTEWYTYLLQRKLIDAFIPFLPLEKKHIIQCIKRDLVSKRFSTNSVKIDKILKELSFSSFGDLTLSNTGCKRVADKVDLVMLDKFSN